MKLKRFLFFIAVLLTSFGVFAQNIGVQGGTLKSPAKVNEVITLSFNVLSTSAVPIRFDPQSPAIIVVTLTKLDPLVNNGQMSVSGSAAEYFDWNYNTANKSIMFIQKKEIPGADFDAGLMISERMEFKARITEPSTKEDMTNFRGNGMSTQVTYDLDNYDGDNRFEVNGYTDGELPLSAKLGSFSAVNKGGMLNVLWSTLAENNNDRFVISASKDGKTFRAIDSLSTQAENGLSEKEIKYTYSKKLNNVAAMLGVSATGAVAIGLLMLGIAFSLYKRSGKKTYISTLALVFAIGLVFAACRKDKNELDSQYAGTMWVQIVQVDKDGTSSNLGVTKVVNE